MVLTLGERNRLGDEIVGEGFDGVLDDVDNGNDGIAVAADGNFAYGSI